MDLRDEYSPGDLVKLSEAWQDKLDDYEERTENGWYTVIHDQYTDRHEICVSVANGGGYYVLRKDILDSSINIECPRCERKYHRGEFADYICYECRFGIKDS